MSKRKIDGLWSHLHWLTVLAEQESFTGAASRLGVSKGSFSMKIAELERVAGIPLVVRTTRSVRLTDVGQRLVDELKKPFQDISESLSSLQDAAASPRGVVRVTAPVAFAHQQLVPKVAGFVRMYPDVRVRLEVSDRLVSLSAEGFDVGIRHSASIPDTHVAWQLCNTRSVVVASDGYLSQYGVPQAPHDLRSHHCLYYPRGLEPAAWSFESVGNGCQESMRLTIPVNGPFATNNSQSLRDAAINGMGIALLPDFTVQEALRSHSLVQVLPDWKPTGAFADKLHIIRPYSARVPKAVSEFIRFLREEFSEGFHIEQEVEDTV